MSIQNWSKDILLVESVQGPEMSDELDQVLQIVRESIEVEVVISFDGVDIITSGIISKLLRLRKTLGDNGQRLVLCSVPSSVERVLIVTGVDSFFDMKDDKFLAITGLNMIERKR